MGIETIKAEVLVRLGITLLERDIVFGNLCWKDGLGDFTGAKDDTVNIVVDAFTNASTRALRSGDTRDRVTLKERKIPVQLSTDVQVDIELTDENTSLDIVDFGRQVLRPGMKAVARAVETVAIAGAERASYAPTNTIDYDPSSDDAWKDVILPARSALQKARVPMDGTLFAALGTNVEEAFLGTDLFIKANESQDGGSAQADAKLVRKGGFTFYSVPGMNPDQAIFGHPSAFALPSRAPAVSSGFPYGATVAQDGFALRVVRGADMASVTDILALDSWMGFAAVTDLGTQDENGVFTPADDPEDSGAEELLIRAVLVTIGSS
jgi:hypothetical protein